MTNHGFSTTALPGPFGVALDGLDLAGASPAQFDALVNLLYEHHILVVRGQDLSPPDYIAFGRKWGEQAPYFQKRWTLPDWPEILLITNEAVPGRALPPAENWHADGTYLDQPHSVTMLYGQEAPEHRGETWFAGTAEAYDGRENETRTKIDTLMVKHVKNGGDKLALAEEHERPLSLDSQTTEEERKGLRPVSHPLVLRHPVTGRPALYCSTTTAYGIEGMEDEEAVSLILEIKRHVLRPQYRQSYKTLPGEILLWDNFAVLHKAAPTPLSNEHGERRLLHRITVNGLPKRSAVQAAA